MKLITALETFKEMELKVSRFYRRCSEAAMDMEWRAFFEKTSLEEAEHARLLTEISDKARNKNLDLLIPVHVTERLGRLIDGLEKGDCADQNWALDKMVQIEGSELNSVYESVIHYHTFNAVPRDSMDDLAEGMAGHIFRIKQAVSRSAASRELKEKAGRLEVKSQNCYKITPG